jgi:hypothetical protein
MRFCAKVCIAAEEYRNDKGENILEVVETADADNAAV